MMSSHVGLFARCAPASGLAEVLRVRRGRTREETRVWLSTVHDGRVDLDPEDEGVRLRSADEAVAWLDGALQQHGLTSGERRAFMRAWEHTLFAEANNNEAERADVANAPPGDHPLGAVEDALLYMLPAAVLDNEFPLEVTPSPASVRRAFVVRADLRRVLR